MLEEPADEVVVVVKSKAYEGGVTHLRIKLSASDRCFFFFRLEAKDGTGKREDETKIITVALRCVEKKSQSMRIPAVVGL